MDVVRHLNVHLPSVTTTVSLQTVTGNKIIMHEKLEVSISFRFNTYNHTVYVVDIIDPCIVGLDFLRKYDLSLNLKKGEL